MGESEQGSGNSMTTGRQEEDELLARMEEDESLLDESDGDNKQPTSRPKEKATDDWRVSSVGTLAKNFMKNVREGANEVFAAPAPANSDAKSALSRAAAPAGTEQASGLPRKYNMVKAAHRNWLSAVALTGIGPLS